ncbi:MAG: hypothetical protein KatS3mg105_3665 [Gemmatales bacterium]|nr:MAG: hypothetical protein KatS3mg105_3665 [Gemmatales bacterium]
MPPISSSTEFVQALREHGILKPAQLDGIDELQTTVRDSQAIAEELTKRRWLTDFQARAILEGHAEDLVLGQYVILDRLGEGGMGEVFKAYHRLMDRIVALKVIRRERLTKPAVINRFHQEIRAAAKLAHPNIVIAHDAAQVGDVHFLVMEYVEGLDLSKLVQKRGPLPVSLACDYIRQAALGLQHAHERGLVHRDIKPSNLLLAAPTNGATGGIVKILDMGLARLNQIEDADAPTALTQDGAIMGTPDYMSPEQASNSRQVDIRSDLYSLGCTFYFLLTGKPPFPEGSVIDKLMAHRLDTPQPVEIKCPDAKGPVADIIRKLMAKKPEDRFQTPAELAEALAPFCGLENVASNRVVADHLPHAPSSATSPLEETRSPESVQHFSTVDPHLPLAGGLQETKEWSEATSGTEPVPPCSEDVAQPAGRRRLVLPVMVVCLGLLAGVGLAAFGLIDRKAPEKKPVPPPGNDLAQKTQQQTTGKTPPPVKDRVKDKDKNKGPIAKPKKDEILKDLIPLASGLFGVGVGPTRMSCHCWLVVGSLEGLGVSLQYPRPRQLGEIAQMSFAGSRINSVDLSADGSLFAVGGDTLRAFRLDQDDELQRKDLPSTNVYDEICWSVDVSPDGNALLAGFGGYYQNGSLNVGRQRHVAEWDLTSSRPPKIYFFTSNAIVGPISHEGIVRCVAYSPDGKWVASGGSKNRLHIWRRNAGADEKPQQIVLKEYPTSLAFSPSGERIAAACGNAVMILNRSEPNKPLYWNEHNGTVTGIDFTSDGRFVVSSSLDGTVRVWDSATGKTILVYSGHGKHGVWCVDVSAKWSRVASADDAGQIHIWRLETGELITKLQGHNKAVKSVRLSADAFRLASGGDDGTFRVWNLR